MAEVISGYPAVAEANVYGVSLPHHDGRAGCAAIVLKNADGSEKDNSTDVDDATLAGLAQHALANLPRYAVPLFVRFPRAIQRTGNNKQQKHFLRAEGADYARISAAGDRMFWLQDGRYRPYGQKEWESINGGSVKL